MNYFNYPDMYAHELRLWADLLSMCIIRGVKLHFQYRYHKNYMYYYITLILRMLLCEYVHMRITYTSSSLKPSTSDDMKYLTYLLSKPW